MHEAELRGGALLILHTASLQPARGFTSAPPTSKLHGGFSTDDCAERVGSQAGVVPHMLLFHRAVDHQVTACQTVVAALRAEVNVRVVLPPAATKNSCGQKKRCFMKAIRVKTTKKKEFQIDTRALIEASSHLIVASHLIRLIDFKVKSDRMCKTAPLSRTKQL